MDGLLVALDLTRRARIDGYHEAQHAVAAALAQSGDGVEAARRWLTSVGSILQCRFGAYWRRDAAPDEMRCAATWRADDGDGLAAFEAATRELVLTPGRGLIDRTWAEAESALIEDVLTYDDFLREHEARSAGLHGALAVPVVVDGAVESIVEYYTTSLLQPESELEALLKALPGQIGQHVARVAVERALSQALRRAARAFLDSPIGMGLIDGRGRWAT